MQMPQIETVRANGLEFAYFEVGEGPLVLCMHGFPDTAHTWLADVAPALASAGYRVVAPFSRGYAPTQIPDESDYSGLTLAQDLVSLVAALGEEDAALVGHDWGAYAGQIAAIMAPERVRALVSVDVPHPFAVQASLSAAWAMRHFIVFQFRSWSVRRLMRNDRAAIAKLWRRWSPSWSFEERDLAPVKACFGDTGVVGAAIDYYREFMRDQRGERAIELKKVLGEPSAVPTLGVVGDEGPASVEDFDYAERFYEGPYEVFVAPGTGHFVHREAPEQTCERITSFLDAYAPVT